MNAYSIVWKAFSRNSDLARRFFIPNHPEGYLPFFLWGEQLKRFQSKQSVELDEFMLLAGIFIGWQDSWMSHLTDKNKETLRYLMDVLGNGFKCETPESMVLSLAANIREKSGNLPASQILRTGIEFIPQSSAIRSDLITDVWTTMSDNNEPEPEQMSEIIRLYEDVNPEEIHPVTLPMISYFYLNALAGLSMQGVLREAAFQRIWNSNHRGLQEKTEELRRRFFSNSVEENGVVQ